MTLSFKVSIRKTEVYKGQKGNTYYVRWAVAGHGFREAFKGEKLASSFRAQLAAAAGRGEAFDTETGLPVSMGRAAAETSWYDFACKFVDMQWPRVAATTRRTHAEALTPVTVAMLTSGRGRPDAALIRRALTRWAFVTDKRDREDCPDEIRAALKWIQENSRPVSALAKPEYLRPVLDAVSTKLDGKPGSPSVASRRRKILTTAIGYAIELKLLAENPISAIKWTAPRTSGAVDRRSVANPVQFRSLLDAVRSQTRSGPRLVAYFGCLYFAAMRPEEAAWLRKRNLAIPKGGWGEIHLEKAAPHAGRDWTDSGENRDERQLKQRAVGETRIVPCPPELTALLHSHIKEFGVGDDGRIFRGERNERELPKLTPVRAWQRARATVFTPEVHASPLAKSPYDLRHAAVSTWLNAGVPPATVAAWAGHSVEVLLRIYAKCLDGEAALLRQRVQDALGQPRRPAKSAHVFGTDSHSRPG